VMWLLSAVALLAVVSTGCARSRMESPSASPDYVPGSPAPRGDLQIDKDKNPHNGTSDTSGGDGGSSTGSGTGGSR
jgi:hypothetical protein